MKQILIIQTAFLGDVILATPLLSELKRIYPEVKLDFLLRKGNESLLANNPHVNQVFTLDKKQGKYKSLAALLKMIRKTHYNEVINLHRYASSGFLCAFSGAASKVGFDKNPLSFLYTKKIKHSLVLKQHEVERNLSCIAHHGAVSKKRPELYPGVLDHEKIKDLTNEPFFCLAPASVWETKKLPENKWVELGKKLTRQGNVYIIGGPSDETLCETIRTQIDSEHCINIAGKYQILESAALMAVAKRNYVNDSGPLHIASAMNAPVTAFFCSTIPDFGFGPLSDNSLIVETLEKLDCRPCGTHGFKSCPKGHFKCGHGISID